jgi:hypothetical protein
VIFDGGEAAYQKSLSSLSPEESHLALVAWCDTEVCNGGFHQFFLNSTGMVAPEASKGFRAVGLPECADLVDEAIGKFSSPYPRKQGERELALKSMIGSGPKGHEWNPFHELDTRYYAAKSRGRFDEVLAAYADRLPPLSKRAE